MAKNSQEYWNKRARQDKIKVIKTAEYGVDNLKKLSQTVGKDKLVIDLSCRQRDGKYFVVTDRWQKFTDVEMNGHTMEMFTRYCDEFLVHAGDVEGKASGIEEKLAEMLGRCCEIPVTYAGGISSFEDLEKLKILGKQKLDFTVGSALDIFGGHMNFEKVAKFK